jgi:predicted phage terminase large subunit-like protein
MTLDADRERAELERELFSRSLREFITGGAMRDPSTGLPREGIAVAGAWDIIEPGNPLEWGWHLDAMCEFIEAVTAGEIQDGLVEAPPRILKSIVFSACWQPWAWAQLAKRGEPIRGPQSRWITPSYADDLSTDNMLKSRNIMQHQWYLDRWGDRFRLATDDNLKTRYSNTERGERRGGGVGGAFTGKGGDIILVDDPLNARDTHAETKRAAVKRWWKEVMPSRRNDPRTGARVVVAQRLHEDDLPGFCREAGYVTLSLPLEYDPKSTCVVPEIGYQDPRELDGELLPGRIGPKERDALQVDMGPFAYGAQYNQQPVGDDDEASFPPAKWGRFIDLPRLEDGAYRRPSEVITSWDLSFEGGDANDWNVGTLWYRYGAALFYLLALVRFKGSFVEQRRRMRDFDRMAREQFPFHPTRHLVEKKANGSSIIDEAKSAIVSAGDDTVNLDDIGLPGVVGFNPDQYGSKVQRVMSMQGVVWAGNVLVPAKGCIVASDAWVPAWMHEWKSFPNGKNDDQCDSGTQALLHFRRRPKPNIG